MHLFEVLSSLSLCQHLSLSLRPRRSTHRTAEGMAPIEIPRAFPAHCLIPHRSLSSSCLVFEHLLAQDPGPITLHSTGNMDMATLNLSPLRVSLRPSLSPPHTQQRFIGQVPGTLLITRDVTVSKTGKVPELTEHECWPRKQG